MKNKFTRVLNGKSGSTLLYVIAAMLFLLVLGTSVLVAAYANMGFNRRQRDHARALVLADSVQRTIMYSLQDNDGMDEDYLAAQIVLALVNSHDDPIDPKDLPDVEISTDLSDDLTLPMNQMEIDSITLSFPSQEVVIWPAQLAIEDLDDPGEIDRERVPKTAHVSATMIVTVTISIDGDPIFSSRTHYQYSLGKLTDDPYNAFVNETVAPPIDHELVIYDAGKWRLLKHENVDL